MKKAKTETCPKCDGWNESVSSKEKGNKTTYEFVCKHCRNRYALNVIKVAG